MKHADAIILEQMPDLITPLRKHPQLTERTTGAFYRGRSDFIHFYHDGTGIGMAGVLAEIRTGTARKRLPVGTPEQRRTVFAFILATLASLPVKTTAAAGPAPKAEAKPAKPSLKVVSKIKAGKALARSR